MNDDDDNGTGNRYGVGCMHDASLVLARFKSHFRLCLSFFLIALHLVVIYNEHS